MRVLVVHNRYRGAMPSGENRAVDRDIAALGEAGVDVRGYLRESDEIDGFGRTERAGLAIRPLHSRADTHRITGIVDGWQPDVIHFHNLYPLISPGFIVPARERGVPVVQTVHNYRHVCANGLFTREGAPCHECAGRRIAIPAIRHGCYRGSRLQSVTMAATLARHRATWRSIDRFVAVSRPIAEFLSGPVGVDPERVVVQPNSIPDPGPVQPPGRGLLYAGRLEDIKGVPLLLAAWERAAPAGWTLTIAGDGPERPSVEDAARRRPDVTYLGPVAPDEVHRLMDAARVVVVPSVAYEAMPMVLVEAFSRGRPVLGTGHGALTELVDPSVGWLCEPTVDSLADAIGRVARGPIPDPAGPRQRFDARYRADVAARWLVEQYRDLIEQRRRDGGPATQRAGPRDVRHSPQGVEQ